MEELGLGRLKRQDLIPLEGHTTFQHRSHSIQVFSSVTQLPIQAFMLSVCTVPSWDHCHTPGSAGAVAIVIMQVAAVQRLSQQVGRTEGDAAHPVAHSKAHVGVGMCTGRHSTEQGRLLRNVVHINGFCSLHGQFVRSSRAAALTDPSPS